MAHRRHGLASQDVKWWYTMMKSSAGNPHPTTLAEAVEILRSALPQDQLVAWAAQSFDEALSDAHFQLGLWIRNAWVHSGPAPFVRRMRELVFCVHDDDISGSVLEALWRVLNGERCPTIEELLERRYPGLLEAAAEGQQG